MSEPTPTPEDFPNGNWIDKWGGCRVCGGEIPHGHTSNCDYWKMERRAIAATERSKQFHIQRNEALKERDEARAELATLKAATKRLRDAAQFICDTLTRNGWSAAPLSEALSALPTL